MRRRSAGGVDPVAHRAALRRIRSHLDSTKVVEATVETAASLVPDATVSLWLTTGREAPRLALMRAAPERGSGELLPPPEVVRCTRSGRRAGRLEHGSLALPVEAPRSGLVGVLSVVCASDPGPQPLEELAEVAAEAGLALGTANLYEQALAMRDKSEAILERVADAVVVTDARGVVTDWNRAARHIAGQSATGAVGRPCAEVLGLRMGETALDCSRGCALLAMGTDSFLGVEAWRPREDGRRQPLLASVSGVADADGTMVQIVHSLRDITKLKEADEAKTMFLATASHELKTPLTVIKGFAETLLRVPGWDPQQREEGLSAIARRAGDLSRIVNRLLLSSRIEAGRVDVEIADVALRPILEERVSALGAATGRDVELDTPPSLPVVRAEVDAFTTILDHLLDNAVKYSPDGGAVVVTAAAGTTLVRVSVADAGIGMDEEQAAHCFDKFWQAESGDARRFGGTGIGLYIVHSLAAAMGADITVASEPGRGTTFTLALARSDAASVAEPQEPALPAVVGEPSVIREFMRQIGIPERGAP
ncbi:MAG: sensor histidine kinase [Actinomycetota bacterium]